jgi:predicted transcriptional regulator
MEFYVARVAIYPWGSGDNSVQRSRTFIDMVKELFSRGVSEADVARGFGMSVSELRSNKSIANAEIKASNIGQAMKLSEHGYSNVEIGKRLGISEGAVRKLLAPGQLEKTTIIKNVADMLRDEVGNENYIQVGKGVENHLGVASTKLRAAVDILKSEGYEVHNVKELQLGTGEKTEIKVLAPPGTTQKDVFLKKDSIKNISSFSEDHGRTFEKPSPPTSIDSSRLAVNWAEQDAKGNYTKGGAEADGVIYIRPGVDDLSLGGSRYAQVRIAVDGTHYIKGMAVYKDDLPDGVDLVFNTSKPKMDNKLDSLKKMSDDPDNPFTSSIKKQNESRVMNIVNEEGDWDKWSADFSSQFLSKQNTTLAEQQLKETYLKSIDDFAEIKSITNPVIKRQMLQTFADNSDSAAVHLKAASFPRTTASVILPVNSLKPTEVYAPGFNDGDRVALVRHPHGGTFEIPELTVNNRNREAKAMIGRGRVDSVTGEMRFPDAIGINRKVAERLSGADFDGDHVLIIPNGRGQIKTSPSLKALENFDPRAMYKIPEGSPIKRMTKLGTQQQMGSISNLITDMTIMGANQDELARAVKHSMVVIDAEKHGLDYRRSAVDNGIPALKAKYQRGGASTLISRARSDQYIPERRLRRASQGGPIDPKTGKLVWEETGRLKRNKAGETELAKTKVDKLSVVDDANKLSSGTEMEKIYANHSNRMKALANQARKEYLGVKNTPYSPSAKKVYAQEVASLTAKLNNAHKNAPLERQATLLSNQIYRAKVQANPGLDKDDKRKLAGRSLQEARQRIGANKERVYITDKEWEAIQAGAISNNMLEEIVRNADRDRVRSLATPRSTILMTPTKLTRAKNMAARGYTQAEIASALGVSLTTLKTGLGG